MKNQETNVRKLPIFEAKLLLDCNNKLAECPLYDDRRGVVCWIDIDDCKYWEYTLDTKQSLCYTLPERVGSFALCAASTKFHLFAFENGPCFYSVESKTFLGKRIFTFESHLQTRPNDGRCDRNGRFVFGGCYEYDKRHPETKYNPISNIYRINTDGTSQIIIRNIACANSICFNENTMYATDSRCWRPQHIKQYQYHQNNGGCVPCNPQIFTSWNEEKCIQNEGACIDGSIMDSEGCVWNAEYNAGRVVIYDTNGNINMIVNVPETYVTCCCFGGKNLDTLFITTRGNLVTNEQKRTLGYDGGALYAVQVPVKGRVEDKFEGTPQSTGCLPYISKM